MGPLDGVLNFNVRFLTNDAVSLPFANELKNLRVVREGRNYKELVVTNFREDRRRRPSTLLEHSTMLNLTPLLNIYCYYCYYCYAYICVNIYIYIYMILYVITLVFFFKADFVRTRCSNIYQRRCVAHTTHYYNNNMYPTIVIRDMNWTHWKNR